MTVNREQNFGNLSTVLRLALEMWSRVYLHTAMPGIVDAYSVSRRRARIRPALRLVLSGEVPGEDGEAMERSLAVNVPVMWPAGGGLVSGFPLAAGDRGLLIFSERGMTEFKQTGRLATPDKARFFDESDAVFVPGDFGHPQDLVIVDSAAAFLQTYNGHTAFLLKEGRIELRVGGSTLVITESDILGNSPHVGWND